MTRRWSTLGLVTFAALAAGAPSAGAQQAPSAPRARVWISCDNCSDDSLAVLRAKVELDRVAAQHDALARSLDEVRRSAADQARIRGEMARLQGDMVRLSRQLSAARPRGWIGLTFEGPQEMHWAEGKMVSTFPEYPVIVAVDPNSPADRAGVQRGDSLLAMNGIDLRRGVVLNEVLRPSTRVALKLRRDSKVREVKVDVARAPSMIVQRRMAFVEGATPAVAPEPPTPPTPPVYRTPRPATPRVFSGTTLPPEVQGIDPETIERVEVVKGSQGTTASIFVFPRVDGLAGADMRTLDADLGESFGISRGVFVVSTAPSSPARESGLRGGDVIITADGREVNTPHDLRMLAAKANAAGGKGERTLKLEVLRAGGKKRTVSLRW